MWLHDLSSFQIPHVILKCSPRVSKTAGNKCEWYCAKEVRLNTNLAYVGTDELRNNQFNKQFNKCSNIEFTFPKGFSLTSILLDYHTKHDENPERNSSCFKDRPMITNLQILSVSDATS